MKQIELPQELMNYVNSGIGGTFVFVNDFSGWGDEAKDVPGVTFFPSMEGNGLKCEATGEIWEPQCSTLRRGNHLTVKLRDYDSENDKSTFKEVKLNELPLFKDFPVVIMTNAEALRAFAPVCSSKLELALFLAAVEAETEKRNAAHEGGYDYSWSRTADNMVSLAKFLYRSNPEKKKSIIDDID